MISCPTDLSRFLPLPIEETSSSPLVPTNTLDFFCFVFVVSIYSSVLCPTGNEMLGPAGCSGCRTHENVDVTECPLVAKLYNLNHCKCSHCTCAGMAKISYPNNNIQGCRLTFCHGRNFKKLGVPAHSRQRCKQR